MKISLAGTTNAHYRRVLYVTRLAPLIKRGSVLGITALYILIQEWYRMVELNLLNCCSIYYEVVVYQNRTKQRL